jgi:hypothetical protein
MNIKILILLLYALIIPIFELYSETTKDITIGTTTPVIVPFSTIYLGIFHHKSNSDFNKDASSDSHMGTATTRQIFVEYLFHENWGLGLIQQDVGDMRSSASAHSESGNYVSVLLGTINYSVDFYDDYLRIGTKLGYGKSEAYFGYEDNYSSENRYKKISSGTVQYSNTYFDWGGEGFGARLSGFIMRTSFPNGSFQGEEKRINVYGYGYSLDLRWSFDM